MSNLLTSTASIIEVPAKTRPAESGRPSIRSPRDDLAAVPGAIRSEWFKLRSVRSNLAILALTVVAGIALSGALAVFVKTDPETHEVFTIADTFILSTLFSAVLAAITGTLMFTSEVQHGTLANVIAARPARWVTIAAKTIIAASFGLALGVVGMIAGFGAAALGGLGIGDTSGMAAAVAWGLLLTTLAAVFGLGVGMTIRHSSGAVSTLLVWTFVIENIVRSVGPPRMTRLLPFSAGDGLLGVHSSGDSPATLAVSLSHTQDAYVFGGYAVAALIVGTLLLYRRDTV